ncbi:MAG TPA: hypothetical protein VMH22_05220 [bacterium]|nr:hypothetical protein [bacterium]
MDSSSLGLLRQFVDLDRAEVVDARATGGEVIKIPLMQQVLPMHALGVVADNLAWFLEQVTGRGYQKAEEVYDIGYTVREPGHQAYGMKVTAEANTVIVARVALLEDDTIFHRYVDYLHTGVLL